MTKNDFKIVLAKKAIDSIIKYTLRPDLAKKRKRREFSDSLQIFKYYHGFCFLGVLYNVF